MKQTDQTTSAPNNTPASSQGTPALKVADYIPKGKENALPMQELARMLQIEPRTLRRQIYKERVKGAIICYNRCGYFRPSTVAELEVYVAVQEKRARSTFRSLRAARAALRQMKQEGSGANG